MKRTMMAMAFACVVLPAVASGAWNANGPYGGFANAVAGSGDNLMIGTSDGIYATADAGGSWQRIGDIPRGTRIESIAISPADPDVILAGAFVNGFRSVDGGTHWTPTNLSFVSVAFHPTATQMVVGFGDSGNGDSAVVCSSDGGATFFSTGLMASVVVPDAFDAGSFIAVDFAGRLYRSSGSCFAWQSAGTVQGSGNAVSLLQDTSDAGVLYISTSILDAGYLWRWDAGSSTATMLVAADSSGPIFSDRVQPGRYWYTAYEVPAVDLFESTDGGITWPDVAAMPGGMLGADPSIADVLYGNDAIGFDVSFDAGRTWQSRTEGVPLISAQAVSHRPDSPLEVVASAGVSVSRTSDGGLTWNWATTPPDEPVLAFARSLGNSNELYAGTHYALYRSEDAGNTWEHVTQGFDYFADIAVDRTNPGKLAAIHNFTVAWSDDAGLTWTPATVEGGAQDFRQIARGPVDTGRVYALAHLHNDVYTLYRADAHGGSVVPTEGGLELTDVAVDPSDDSVLFAVAHDDSYQNWTAYLSVDAGAHWEQRGSTLQGFDSGAFVRFDPCDPWTIYFVLGPTGMYVSHDRGLTWTLESPELTFGFARAFDVACSAGQLVMSVASYTGVEVRDPAFVESIFVNGFDGE